MVYYNITPYKVICYILLSNLHSFSVIRVRQQNHHNKNPNPEPVECPTPIS